MTSEVWRWVPGYEGHYMVSDHGRMRSVDRYIDHASSGKQFVRGRVLRLGLDTHGYPRLNLRRDGELRSWAVHRAVLAAFMPRPDWESWHVNHKDGNTTNNRLSNLEWTTAGGNRWHAYHVLGRAAPPVRRGATHPNAQPVIGECIANGQSRNYASMADVANDGFIPSLVSACATGAQKSHKGWVWRHPDAPRVDYQPPAALRGAHNPSAKPVVRISADGSTKRYDTAAEATAEGFTTVGISHCVTGRQARHRGYVWRYAETEGANA